MSEVPPQGRYSPSAARRGVQLDVLQPCEPLPTSSFISMLGEEGKDFEADIFERLARGVPDAVVIDENLPRSAREAATVAAMDDGVPLVIGGRLPVDRMALRVGEPDLLVRSDAFSLGAAAGGYLPVDVKHHKTLDRTNQRRRGSRCDHFRARGAVPRSLPNRTPQLGPSGGGPISSSWPIINGCSRHPAGHPWLGRWAGIVGREERVVWYDLDLPLVASDRVHRRSAGTAALDHGGLRPRVRASPLGDRRVTHSPDGSDVSPPGRTDRRAGVRRVWVAGLVLRADGGVG